MRVPKPLAIDIRLSLVPEVDEQNADCQQCEREFAPIEAQVYYEDRDTGRALVGCCMSCLAETVRDALRKSTDAQRITVEIGEVGFDGLYGGHAD